MSLGTIIRQRREAMGLTQDRVAEQAGISKPYLSNIETGKAKNPPTDGVLTALERVMAFKAGELTGLAHLARTPVDVRQQHELMTAEVGRLRSVIASLLSPKGEGQERPVDAGNEDMETAQATRANIKPLSAGVVVPIINKVSAGYPHHFTDLDYPTSVADEYTRCPDLHDPQAFGARVAGDSMEPAYIEGDIVIFSPNTLPRSGDDCFVRFETAETTFKRYYQDDEQTIRLQPLNNKYPAQSYHREKITGLWPAVLRIQKLRRD